MPDFIESLACPEVSDLYQLLKGIRSCRWLCNLPTEGGERCSFQNGFCSGSYRINTIRQSCSFLISKTDCCNTKNVELPTADKKMYFYSFIFIRIIELRAEFKDCFIIA